MEIKNWLAKKTDTELKARAKDIEAKIREIETNLYNQNFILGTIRAEITSRTQDKIMKDYLEAKTAPKVKEKIYSCDHC